MEGDLDREIAAAQDVEERDMIKHEMGSAGSEEEAAESEIEAQLMADFAHQLTTDQTFLDRSMSAAKQGGKISRVNRMRAECAAWGAVAGAVSYTHLTLPTKRIV
eukprot:TRINITY_DN8232_c0_g1_i1.p2 TRINITY_DN8232_c0_g1~~TRINITY_DN8232_c0_g1_i1.p2  ORF type:complete len:105 (+),score=27.08 TRINITY_DN8232_c0_g1_i1:367-681(+)